MDLEYMGRLMLSCAIFAPGLILLAFLSFLGLIMLAEKANMFRKSRRVELGANALVSGATARNPTPGRIAAALTEAIASEAAEGENAPGTDSEKVHNLRKDG